MRRLTLLATLTYSTALMADAIDNEVQRFENALRIIDNYYVTKPDVSKAVDGAIKGMLSELDPHSTYLTEEDIADLNVSTQGEFGGLGIEINSENGAIRVVSPIDDTPAKEAGLLPGDWITHADGESLIGYSLKEAVSILRGPPGSNVTVTIFREGTPDPFDVKITRDIIVVKSAKVSTAGNFVIVRLAIFNEQTLPALEEGVEKSIAELGGIENVEGFIVDVRSNPGGLLTAAIEVSDAFLEEGAIVSTQGRDQSEIQLAKAKKGDISRGKPLAVLIDGGSASASEIFAGAIKDLNRGIVIGTTSFGKGSVQTILNTDETSALKLTTALYYTPSGQSIQNVGVEPDIYIEPIFNEVSSEEDEKDIPDFSRSENQLRNSITNETLTDEEIEALEAEHLLQEELNELRQKDNQMAYAIDVLKSAHIFGDY